MGSVLDWIECPNCKSDGCASDFYYKTGEEYLNCGDCGYHRSVTIRDESREKRLNELQQSDWELKEVRDPWGYYRLKEKGNIGFICGTLTDENQYDQLLKAVNDNLESVEELALSRLVDGNIVKVKVVETGRLINEFE